MFPASTDFLEVFVQALLNIFLFLLLLFKGIPIIKKFLSRHLNKKNENSGSHFVP